ncbi:hypothetical protein [Photorhabdus australis]|nr:hypothetical protein [Photorhabdus australis]
MKRVDLLLCLTVVNSDVVINNNAVVNNDVVVNNNIADTDRVDIELNIFK